MSYTVIGTDRLLLRQWKYEDVSEFCLMNLDERVMKHFPSLVDENDSLAGIERYARSIDVLGYGYFAVERRNEKDFIGFIGIMDQIYTSPYTPALDIGWRLKPSAWGMGYATEGALAVKHYAYDQCGLDDIISVATSTNIGSHRVMQKIGMSRIGEFDHPNIPDESPLKRCWVFK